MQGQLWIVAAPSGGGKTSLIAEAVRVLDDVVESVSHTTRPARPGEIEGVHYFFVPPERFQAMIDADGFLEYAQVYGNFYGTPKAKVLQKLSEGVDVILEIDIQGAMKVKKAYEEGIFIFILPPSMSVLRKRLTGRGTDSLETIDMRLSHTLEELSYIEEYDYVVVNGELQEAVDRVKAIVTAKHSRVTESIKQILLDSYKEGK